MQDIARNVLTVALPSLYIYAQFKAFISWNGGWRLLAWGLGLAEMLGAVYFIKQQSALLPQAVQVGSAAGILVIAILAASRMVVAKAH